VEELTSAKGIGPALAAAVVQHLGATEDSGETAPAVNMTTGEILES
jgi:excinuclease ABC subunit C